MPLIPTSPDDTPADRAALYRQRGVTHAVLLLPWDTLSPLRQEAARQLATEWAGELAQVDTARRDLAHAEPDKHEVQLAGLWLMRLLAAPIHQADAHEWVTEVGRWSDGEGTDPRLRAFIDAWHRAAAAHPPVPPPGPELPVPRLHADVPPAPTQAPMSAATRPGPCIPSTTTHTIR